MDKTGDSWEYGDRVKFLPDIYSPAVIQSKLYRKLRKPSDLKKEREEEEKARKEKLKWERMQKDNLEGRKIQKRIRKDLPENFENLLHEIMTYVLLKKPCPDKMHNCISQYLEKQLLIRTASKYNVEKYEEFYDQDFQDLIAVPMLPSKIDKVPPGMEHLMMKDEAQMNTTEHEGLSKEDPLPIPDQLHLLLANAENLKIFKKNSQPAAPSTGKKEPSLIDYLDEAAKSGEPSTIDVLLSQIATEEVDFPSPYNEESSFDRVSMSGAST